MRVHVLHHGRCFDGAASAALFAAFMRARHGLGTNDPGLDLRYVPKHHRHGDPFEDADFAGADEAAVVDFRYTQRPGLTWYFDHHRSAFQLDGDRSHFEADRSGRKFHDPAAPSC
ncbi:MAG: phosphoesterase, partial [Myxococcales bacterium]|nr:phosphoesterase [Myxococcales bacterium]